MCINNGRIKYIICKILTKPKKGEYGSEEKIRSFGGNAGQKAGL